MLPQIDGTQMRNHLCQAVFTRVLKQDAKPHCSVSSIAALRTRGRCFDPRLGQYSFRGLMIVIVTGFIPLSLLSIVSTFVMWESSHWLGKNIVLVKRTPGKHGLVHWQPWYNLNTFENGIEHHTINQSIWSRTKTCFNVIFQLIHCSHLQAPQLRTDSALRRPEVPKDDYFRQQEWPVHKLHLWLHKLRPN